MNVFLKKIDDSNFVDIKYQVGVSINDDENQIYCFSAMIVYKDKKELAHPALFMFYVGTTCVGNTFIIDWVVPNFFVVKEAPCLMILGIFTHTKVITIT